MNEVYTVERLLRNLSVRFRYIFGLDDSHDGSVRTAGQSPAPAQHRVPAPGQQSRGSPALVNTQSPRPRRDPEYPGLAFPCPPPLPAGLPTLSTKLLTAYISVIFMQCQATRAIIYLFLPYRLRGCSLYAGLQLFVLQQQVRVEKYFKENCD